MKWLVCAFSLFVGYAQALAADRDRPIVVELFQSQGCSSCPPANRNVLAIADRPDILALSWEVTYWDYLGWRDTFGDHAFTQRQYDYAKSLGHDGVFTPQVVVNGRMDGVGADPGELRELIDKASARAPGPEVTLANGQVRIGAAPGAGEVVLVRYDPALVQVAVHRGENAGETLPHRNVVRQLVYLGKWNGGQLSLTLPVAPRAGLRTVVLVQAGRVGAVLAVGRD